jgi:hypothetical protein
MADVINMRQARKARIRTASEAQAQTNRLMHGRTKAEKLAARQERQRADTKLDGAKRERDPE